MHFKFNETTYYLMIIIALKSVNIFITNNLKFMINYRKDLIKFIKYIIQECVTLF